jgi:hypothetical protein
MAQLLMRLYFENYAEEFHPHKIISTLIKFSSSLFVNIVSCQHPGPELNRINRIPIPTSCNFFFESPSSQNSKLSVLDLERWVTDREILPGCARVRTKCAEKTCVCLRAVYVLESGQI